MKSHAPTVLAVPLLLGVSCGPIGPADPPLQKSDSAVQRVMDIANRNEAKFAEESKRYLIANGWTTQDLPPQRIIALADEMRAQKEGKWRARTETSPLDDRTNVYLSLEADSPITGWLEKEHVPTLMIRCKEGKTDAFIVTGMEPTTDYGEMYDVSATVRYDKDVARRMKMIKSDDGEALFFREPVRTAKEMMNHRKLLFLFSPFNSSPAMTTFNLTGLTEAIAPLSKRCAWPKTAPSGDNVSASSPDSAMVIAQSDYLEARQYLRDHGWAPDPNMGRQDIMDLAAEWKKWDADSEARSRDPNVPRTP